MDFLLKFVIGTFFGSIIFLLVILICIVLSPVTESPKDNYSIIEYNNHEYIDFRNRGVVHNPDCGFCLSNKLEVVN